MSERPEDAPLTCGVENGRLVIAIGIETLAYAFIHGPVGDRLAYDEDKADWDHSRVRVTDPEQWAKEIEMAMEHEDEDGSSPLTNFIDKMYEAALDDGATSVHIPHLGLVDDDADESID
jgi:hypothetical protein